ncbi:MAG: hypothetical protein ACTSRU_11630 [Candidatus Hodarchaeales archaeon]
MSKKLCPFCGVVMPGDSSFCANCGREIIEKKTGSPVVSKSGEDISEILMRTGDYLFPKIVVIITASVPILAVIGLIIVSSSSNSISNTTPVIALSFIAIFSSIISYLTFRKTLEQL